MLTYMQAGVWLLKFCNCLGLHVSTVHQAHHPKPLSRSCPESHSPCLLQKGEAKAKVAIADSETSEIHIFDVRSGGNEPFSMVQIHRAAVRVMRYNLAHDTVISVDEKGKMARSIQDGCD